MVGGLTHENDDDQVVEQFQGSDDAFAGLFAVVPRGLPQSPGAAEPNTSLVVSWVAVPMLGHGVEGRVSVQSTIRRRSAKYQSPSIFVKVSR